LNGANSDATDVTLERLKNVRTLKYLDLEGTPITDAGLEHLTDLPLESLDVHATEVSNEGLRHIGAMQRLRTLNLAGTNVDDDGLEHLRGLTNLRRLMLKDTGVTDDGVKSLQESLQYCQIYSQSRLE